MDVEKLTQYILKGVQEIISEGLLNGEDVWSIVKDDLYYTVKGSVKRYVREVEEKV